MLLKNADLNQVIIKKTITTSPNTSLLDAREILLRHNLKRLVVIDSKKRPVGIITEKDIAKTITESEKTFQGKNIDNKKIKNTSRFKMPDRRKGYIQKAQIGDHKV